MSIIVDADGSGPVFATVQDAAIVALKQCEQLGQDRREYGGVIYSATDGTIHYTVPVAGERFGLDFFVRADGTVRLLALFHNHPRGPYSKYFSGADVATSHQMHLQSFMYSASTNEVYVLNPDNQGAGLTIDEDGTIRMTGRIVRTSH